MACKLPSTGLWRAQLAPSNSCSISATCTAQQIRHASLLKRPHRPYTFTQLVTLSDGSTYTHRTTSPAPIYRSAKDTRNHPVWQPSLHSLRNVEQDDAGRLKAFRRKFGRGWDVDGAAEQVGEGAEEGMDGDGDGGLMDLISGVKPQEAEVKKSKKSGLQQLEEAVEKSGKEATRAKPGKKAGVWG
ncbi:related to ribosomal protein YmL36 precursor, mitochondrial [Rhynchosporium agropyri]|uniref:Related to ribosomal protein YmL36, mitochondrial n=1 Tax=Rhynchosporium agropyri TaxID=914238 RepID=A0A1E1LC59_9HELO|nr:related to ribosomal protein YmL36 precursor, mitochondrial [Rhynchosporium agropyri]